jgi:hypothetical protein
MQKAQLISLVTTATVAATPVAVGGPAALGSLVRTQRDLGSLVKAVAAAKLRRSENGGLNGGSLDGGSLNGGSSSIDGVSSGGLRDLRQIKRRLLIKRDCNAATIHTHTAASTGRGPALEAA